jgi:hypothetical protein
MDLGDRLLYVNKSDITVQGIASFLRSQQRAVEPSIYALSIPATAQFRLPL